MCSSATMTIAKEETKKEPLASTAYPPLTAVASVGLFVLIMATRFPSMESVDEVATVALFTRRIFPDVVSLDALILIRLAFFILVSFISVQVTCFSPGWDMKATYLPASKLRREIIKMTGIRTQLPFTSVTWNLLGISFGLSSYIAFMARIGQPLDQWTLRAALLIWEVSAPNTILVSAIVRYAIWPTALKHGSSASCKSWRALVWHNANSAMSLVEAGLLGGLPVKVEHMALSVFLGSFYCLFSWLYMDRWVPGKGSHFIYFFLDTTLGRTSIISLYILIGVFLLIYILFSAATQTLVYLDQGIWVNSMIVIASFGAVCRFRD